MLLQNGADGNVAARHNKFKPLQIAIRMEMLKKVLIEKGMG